MRYAPVAFALAVALCLSATAASANHFTTFPLHALATTFGPCPIPGPSGPDPCDQGTSLNNIPGNADVAIYLLARNYDEMCGVQTAFDFSVSAWGFTFGSWDCQSNQLSSKTPASPWGPSDGTITTAFDPVLGGATAPIGRMHFSAQPKTGCIIQVESDFPFGTHLVDCSQNDTQVPPEQRGSVCADADGTDACGSVPVETTTWGNIKNQFAR